MEAADVVDTAAAEDLTLLAIFRVLRARIKSLILAPIAAGVLAYGVAWLMPSTFTAVTTFMPPQQTQSTASLTAASLGALANLAGGMAGVRTTGDQYIALMQSITVSDRIIDQFGLMATYDKTFRADTRKVLASNVRFGLGKKDGWITVEVDDKSPQRAADIANRYVDEVRRLSGSLAVTEAQQRRVFFEQQLQRSRDRLAEAQRDLEASGFNAGALKAEPRAAADAYARLKADATAAEVRLQGLRSTLADGTPAVRQQQEMLSTLRNQLLRAEQAETRAGGSNYVGKYREFKYQETLFELYARQFELARVDESREGALIQVVDAATPPERRSAPKRMNWAISAMALTSLLLTGLVLVRHSMRGLSSPRP